jgi:hypothetical protein
LWHPETFTGTPSNRCNLKRFIGTMAPYSPVEYVRLC